jgi:hypothetical protein
MHNMFNIQDDKVLFSSSHMANIDSTYGNWRFDDPLDLDLKIQNSVFSSFIQSMECIDFSLIAWKGKNLKLNQRGSNCICCNGLRYEKCNTKFPGILVKGGPNPFNLPYRLVDGKHRIEKLISRQHERYVFCILSYDKLKKELINLPRFKTKNGYEIIWNRNIKTI